MGDQKDVNGQENGSPDTGAKALVKEAGEVTDGLFTLADLQFQLIVADLKECSRRSLVPVAFLLCGTAIGIGCFPILLTAVALSLVQAFEVSHAVGFLLAAGGGAVLSLLLCLIGWRYFSQHLTILRRSQAELRRNLSWISRVFERKRTTRNHGLDNSRRTMR